MRVVGTATALVGATGGGTGTDEAESEVGVGTGSTLGESIPVGEVDGDSRLGVVAGLAAVVAEVVFGFCDPIAPSTIEPPQHRTNNAASGMPRISAAFAPGPRFEAFAYGGAVPYPGLCGLG